MNKSVVQKREKKVTVMVLLMFSTFMAVWSPYAIICLLRLTNDIVSPPIVVGYAMLCAKTGGVLNPIIFILMNSHVSSFFKVCFFLKKVLLGENRIIQKFAKTAPLK